MTQLHTIKIRPGERHDAVRVWYDDTELHHITAIEYRQDFSLDGIFPVVTITFLAKFDVDMPLRAEDATLATVPG